MFSRQQRLARLRSLSTDRSRSVTPASPGPQASQRPSAARRALLMGLTLNSPEVDPQVEAQPLKKVRASQALLVQRTPGGSVNVTGDVVNVADTPGGHVRVVTEPQLPLCSDVLERVEAMDLSEDEAEDVLEGAPWHVQRWVKHLPSFTASAEPTSSENRPSTSGMAVISGPKRKVVCEDSDLDSDFDDEFDVCPIEATTFTGLDREIPTNDELEEPVREIVDAVQRAMDDEIDRVVGEPIGFEWAEGFESFRGRPEFFSGPTPGPLKDYDTPYDAFCDIWSGDIMESIASETNRYAEQTITGKKEAGVLGESSRLHQWKPTDVDELFVLFGVFMYMGIDARTSQNEYWKANDYLELSKFRQIMTYNRFILLNKFLHFVDNSNTRQDYLQSEGISKRLTKLSPIIIYLNKKFSSLYNLEREISIDESLTLFKGRLSWVQTIRSKAARFGIKSYELCESRTGYMYKFQIHAGKNSDVGNNLASSADLGGKSTQVVLQLINGLDHRGHSLTMDNFYNSPSLARHLKFLGFDCLGTLRPNRKNVPDAISKLPKNIAKGTIVSRHCGDVSIVAWKDVKIVNIISTFHTDATYAGTKAGKALTKPVCVRDYNHTMGGVDLKDQKLSLYLLERKRGVKWYMKMFKRLLNVSIHNAFILYVGSLKRRNKTPVTHREFRYELAKSLVDYHRSTRCAKISEPGDLMRLRRDIVHRPKISQGKDKIRKRCVVCFRQDIDSKVSTQCVTCDVFLCFEENCWDAWHSSAILKGKEKRGRKRLRNA